MEDTDNKLCPNCGAELRADAKFCRYCGQPVTAAHPAYVSVEDVAPPADPSDVPSGEHDDADRQEQNADAPAAEQEQTAEREQERDPFDTPPEHDAQKFCMRCGARLDADETFCHGCGTRVGSTGSAGIRYENTVTAVAASGAMAVDPAVNGKRKLGGILYIVGAAISIIFGFVFFCTPFMSVRISALGYNASCSQSGPGLIGVMFGARSDLVDAGVNSTLLIWIGWLYFAFLLSLVYHAVCFGCNVKRYIKGERPYRMLFSSLDLLFAGLLILIFGCIARAQAGVWMDNTIDAEAGADLASLFHTSSYMGFIGLFVIPFVGSMFVIAAHAVSSRTFPPFDKKQKKRGAVLAIFVTDIVCGVIAALAVLAPVMEIFVPDSADEIEVKAGDSGTAKITCDEKYGDFYYVGATVFKLEESYGNYVFRIETNDVSQSALVGSIVLMRYDDVKDKDADEIFEAIGPSHIDANTESQTGSNYAYLYTPLDGYDYAIVVGFMATGKGVSVTYDYSFE